MDNVKENFFYVMGFLFDGGVYLYIDYFKVIIKMVKDKGV